MKGLDLSDEFVVPFPAGTGQCFHGLLRGKSGGKPSQPANQPVLAIRLLFEGVEQRLNLAFDRSLDRQASHYVVVGVSTAWISQFRVVLEISRQ